MKSSNRVHKENLTSFWAWDGRPKEKKIRDEGQATFAFVQSILSSLEQLVGMSRVPRVGLSPSPEAKAA